MFFFAEPVSPYYISCVPCRNDGIKLTASGALVGLAVVGAPQPSGSVRPIQCVGRGLLMEQTSLLTCSAPPSHYTKKA